VLAAADVHVAARLARLAGEEDPRVLLAAALAVRAPRLRHVYVDLATASETTVGDDAADVGALPWPPAGDWVRRVAESPLAGGPLQLDGSRLYLDRYWREERQTAADLQALAGAREVDEARLADGLARLFGPDDELQRRAAEAALRRRLAVIAGGPGTGKTTTVARIVALLAENQSPPAPLPHVALAAPTAKAANRLQEAVHDEAERIDVSPQVREWMQQLDATTLHRLLGRRQGSSSRFRHHRGNRLPHDAIVVDETSMVSLSQMSRLLEAVRPGARLVLVGDPAQLSSIEAGAVLGDIVGPASGEGIVVLERVHRYGAGIDELATAIRAGDAAAALQVLEAAPEGVTWLRHGELAPVREGAVATGRALFDAARAGDATGALEALDGFRVLCAHRQGPAGVTTWTAAIERWLTEAVPGFSAERRPYAGQPLLVTENDYGLGLFNGDAGVVVAEDGRLAAAFKRGRGIERFSPGRLDAVETVFAMTVHKSQGSQFGTAAVLLPDLESRLLTRELLYTAITRARERLILAGTEETIRVAVERPIARASGLRRLLWSA
jgi:exodeoxyribonuclease V alpha subunit